VAARTEKPRESNLVRTLKAYSDELPNAFAIISWGCTATRWLAKVLNGHSDILAVHHFPFHMLDLPDAQRPSEVELIEYLRALGVGYELVGDVHGFPLAAVPKITDRLGDRFRACGLVREPLPRLRSLMALYERYGSDIQSWGGLEYVRALPGFADIRTYINSDDRLMFVHGANMLNTVVDEIAQLPRVYRYEDITTNPGALVEMTRELSGGRILLDHDFSTRALAVRRTNDHSRGATVAWRVEPWKLAVLRAIVSEEAWRVYADLGYVAPWDTASRAA
jgi:hypothetical protein